MIMKLFSCYNNTNHLEITLNSDMNEHIVCFKSKGGANNENES